jgi:hypothetical protein
MLKFQVSTVLFFLLLIVACQKQADSTPIDGSYIGFYALDTFKQVPVHLEFDNGKFRFNFIVRDPPVNYCQGSFSIADSTLKIIQTRDEFCNCNCDCSPNANCIFNPITNAIFTFKSINNELNLAGTSPVSKSISPLGGNIVFNLKKE